MTTDSSQGMTLEELVRGRHINSSDIARLLNDPHFPSNGRITPERLGAFLESVGDVIATVDDNKDNDHLEDEGLVLLYDPQGLFYYVTVMVNGKPQYSRTDFGALDTTRVVPSLEPLINILVRSGATEEAHVLFRRKVEEIEKTKDKKRPSPGATQKPGYLVDDRAVEWCKHNGEFVILEHLSGSGRGSERKALDNQTTVAAFGIEGFRHIQQLGLQPMFQPWSGFIREHSRNLRKAHTIYVTEVRADPLVSSLIADFYKSSMVPKAENGLPDILGIFRIGNEEMDQSTAITSAEEVLRHTGRKSYVLAREIYRWFSKEITRRSLAVQPRVAIDIVRNDLRSNPFMTKLDPQIQTSVRECTALWISYAVATDAVNTDSYITKTIIPLLQNDTKDPVDRQFEAACLLANRCRDPTAEYSTTKYTAHIKGLWMLGLIKTGEEEKTGRGNEVTYISPARHVLQRTTRYDSLLFRSFDYLVDRELIKPEEVQFFTSEQYSTLGRRLYLNLHEDEQAQFTWLISNRRLAHESTSAYLYNVLKFWVGMNKDHLQQRAREKGLMA